MLMPMNLISGAAVHCTTGYIKGGKTPNPNLTDLVWNVFFFYILNGITLHKWKLCRSYYKQYPSNSIRRPQFRYRLAFSDVFDDFDTFALIFDEYLILIDILFTKNKYL